MCARYSLRATNALIADLFDLMWVPAEVSPRYNIAPTQNAWVVRPGPDGPILDSRSWGLIPNWARDPSVRTKLINARSETVMEKPSFREAWRHRRCLVPADGFFEWRIERDGKQPFHIRFRDQHVFAMAGLYESWTGPDGSVEETFTILTTDASPWMADLHDRMPVILPPEAHRDWLYADDPNPLRTLFAPFESSELEKVPVTRKMSRSSFEDPSCVERIAIQEPLF